MSHPTQDQLLEEFTRDRCVLEGYILAIVQDPHLAEDVYQDTAVEVIKNLPKFDGDRSFRAWILGIARNKAKQALTRVSRLMPTAEDRLAELVETAYQEQSTADWEALSSFHRYLRHCLAQLSASLQQMVRLRYDENLSARLVGERLGKSAGAVDVALSRAREALSICIQKQQGRELAGGGTGS